MWQILQLTLARRRQMIAPKTMELRYTGCCVSALHESRLHPHASVIRYGQF